MSSSADKHRAAEKAHRQTQSILSLESAIKRAIEKSVEPYNAKIADLEEQLRLQHEENAQLEEQKHRIGESW